MKPLEIDRKYKLTQEGLDAIQAIDSVRKELCNHISCCYCPLEGVFGDCEIQEIIEKMLRVANGESY